MSIQRILRVTRGDDRVARCVVTDEAGDPFAWAGATFWWAAKLEFVEGDDEAIVFETSDGDIEFDGDGVALVPIKGSRTKELPNEEMQLHFDAQVLTADGKAVTVESGVLIVEPEVVLATGA